MNKIAFVTANYFARAMNYKATITDWGLADRRTLETFSLHEFNQICADIAGAGFQYVELWQTHGFPKFMTPDLALELKKIWEKHGLSVIGYAADVGDPVRSPRWTRLVFEAARMLGISMISGGVSGSAVPHLYEYCREYGIKVALENHPEKHPDEILAKIGDHGDWIGACVDTGWFGTQGYPAPDALRRLKGRLMHVHLKDVKAAGGHHTVALGNGVVDIEGCVQVLKEIGYTGIISIEHESEEGDPTAECAQAKRWVEELLRR